FRSRRYLSARRCMVSQTHARGASMAKPWFDRCVGRVLLMAATLHVLASTPCWGLQRANDDIDTQALVQRLTLEHAAVIAATRRLDDAREQELIAQLTKKNDQLRARETALKAESQQRAATVAELKAVRAELESVARQLDEAVKELARHDQQFAA